MNTTPRCLTLIAAACLTLGRPVNSFAQTYEIFAVVPPAGSDAPNNDRIYHEGSLYFINQYSYTEPGSGRWGVWQASAFAAGSNRVVKAHVTANASGTYGASTTGSASASYRDSVLISAPGVAVGTPGTATFSLDVPHSISSEAVLGSASDILRNDSQASFGAGVGTTAVFFCYGTGFYYSPSCVEPSQHFTGVVSFQFGVPFDFSLFLELDARVRVDNEFDPSGPPSTSAVDFNFERGVRWGGFSNVTANGIPLGSGGYSAIGGGGVDYVQPWIDTAPVAVPQSLTTQHDNSLAIGLTGSDSDSDPITFAVVDPPSHGTLTGTAPNLTYIPAPNYAGPDRFTFKVNDGTLDSTPATVNITVKSLPGLAAVWADSPYEVLIQWDEPVSAASATTPSNYVLDGGLSVTAATLVNPSLVKLSTSRHQESTTYALHIQGVQDAAGNPSTVDTSFRSLRYAGGQVRLRTWPDDAGVFSAFASEGIAYRTTTRDETKPGYFSGENLGDTYFGQLRGWVTPDVTDDYVLFCASDDESTLYLSTDESPLNKLSIASVPGWTSAREWNKYPQQQSAPVRLQAGQAYYLELVWREGAVGDHGAVAVKRATEANPANGGGELSGSRIGDYIAAAASRYTLTLAGSPFDGGTIQASPLPQADGQYAAGTIVTLTSLPATGFTFVNWSGDAASTLATVQITVNADATVAANFRAPNRPPVASAGGPYTITQGSNLLLDASGSFDPDTANGDSIVSYSWDLNGDGTFGDASSSSPTLTLNSGQISGLGLGTRSIAVRVTDSFGATGTASTTLSIRATQTITFDPIPDHIYGDAPFTVSASASSGLPVSFTSRSPAVVTVSGITVTIVGTGTATIRASQPGDGSYLPATDVEHSFIVSQPIAPVANAQSVTAAEDTTVSIALSGSNPIGAQLGYTVISSPTNGTLAGAVPNLTYTPNTNFNGSDSFTFKVNNGSLDSAPAAVSITVTPVNDPPVAVDDAFTVDEDHSLTITSPGLLANDSDPDMGRLPRFSFAGHVESADADFNAGERFVGFYTVDPGAAVFDDPDPSLKRDYLSQNATWEISFPDRGYHYVANAANLWVMVGNDTSSGDRYIVDLASPSSIGTALPSARLLNTWQLDFWDQVSAGADLLNDDSIQATSINLAAAEFPRGRLVFRDGSQTYLTYDQLVGPMTITEVNGLVERVNTTIQLASGATLKVNSNGSFSYNPTGRFDYLSAGETATESFSYKVSDPDGLTSTATATITVTGLNDLPVLASPIPAQTATYGSPLSYLVPANTFTDPDNGQSLAYSASGLPAGISFNPATRTLQGTPTVSGNFALQITASDNGSPALSASTTFTLSVNQAALNVTADNLTRAYGHANPTLTGTLTGVVNGDNLTASYTTTATAASPTGSYPISAALNDPGNLLSNYFVTKVNGTLSITAASQTISFGPIAAHSYGDAAFTLNASASSALIVTLTSLSPGVATVSGNSVTIVGAGTATIRASQAGDVNYLAAASVDQTLTVARANQSITFNPPATSTYGADVVLNGTASSGLTVSYAVTGPATLNGALLHLTSVGTVTVTATQGGNANYNAAVTVTRSIAVGKAALTVTADNKVKAFGQANPPLTATYSGLVNGDTASVLKGSPKLSTTATTASSVGTYPINIVQGTLSSANYSFAFVNGAMAVTVANTRVTAANVTIKFGSVSAALSASVAALTPSTATVSEGTVSFTIKTSAGVTVGQPVTGGVSKGTATASFPAGSLARGTYSIEVIYLDALAAPNFNNSSGAATGMLTIK